MAKTIEIYCKKCNSKYFVYSKLLKKDKNKFGLCKKCKNIKSENKIIEVKSTWTINLHKEIVELKKDASLKNNINFEFKIY